MSPAPASEMGGQLALSGFWIQAIWAVLDGFRRDDWIALTIEPSENQRVDLKWELARAQRHDQVKSTSRTFTKRGVESWAGELEGASAAAELRLVLFGNLGRGMTNGLTFGRVRVESTPATMTYSFPRSGTWLASYARTWDSLSRMRSPCR